MVVSGILALLTIALNYFLFQGWGKSKILKNRYLSALLVIPTIVFLVMIIGGVILSRTTTYRTEIFLFSMIFTATPYLFLLVSMLKNSLFQKAIESNKNLDILPIMVLLITFLQILIVFNPDRIVLN